MPAYCTHYIFACELLPALTELAGFDLNRDAVMLGTQGPDVFFFHRIAPWMPGRSQRKIGSRLHRAKPGDILDAMAEYCTRCSTEKDIARSYAYGFILHYALDRLCHPFVYAKQQELADSGSPLHKSALHNIVEMSMDAVLLHEKLHIDDPRCFDTAVTVPDDPAVLDEVARLLYRLPSTGQAAATAGRPASADRHQNDAAVAARRKRKQGQDPGQHRDNFVPLYRKFSSNLYVAAKRLGKSEKIW